jgi:hypothetical protein
MHDFGWIRLRREAGGPRRPGSARYSRSASSFEADVGSPADRLALAPFTRWHGSAQIRASTPKEIAMIGYVTPGTNDLRRARSFYDALLAEMGVTRMMEFGDRGYAWDQVPRARHPMPGATASYRSNST